MESVGWQIDMAIRTNQLQRYHATCFLFRCDRDRMSALKHRQSWHRLYGGQETDASYPGQNLRSSSALSPQPARKRGEHHSDGLADYPYGLQEVHHYVVFPPSELRNNWIDAPHSHTLLIPPVATVVLCEQFRRRLGSQGYELPRVKLLL